MEDNNSLCESQFSAALQMLAKRGAAFRNASSTKTTLPGSLVDEAGEKQNPQKRDAARIDFTRDSA